MSRQKICPHFAPFDYNPASRLPTEPDLPPREYFVLPRWGEYVDPNVFNTQEKLYLGKKYWQEAGHKTACLNSKRSRSRKSKGRRKKSKGKKVALRVSKLGLNSKSNHVLYNCKDIQSPQYLDKVSQRNKIKFNSPIKSRIEPQGSYRGSMREPYQYNKSFSSKILDFPMQVSMKYYILDGSV